MPSSGGWKGAWRKLWTVANPVGSDVDDWLEAIKLLPPCPKCVAWDGLLVREVLFSMKTGKAVGLDGWTISELRQLPPFLLQWLAELFNLVEELGRWPFQLASPEGVLLPKGGTEDPLDRRPVWLLSMPYKVWAAGRARHLSHWFSSWAHPDGGQGAENQSWMLALELRRTGSRCGWRA